MIFYIFNKISPFDGFISNDAQVVSEIFIKRHFFIFYKTMIASIKNKQRNTINKLFCQSFNFKDKH
jgi:hypothetical protein